MLNPRISISSDRAPGVAGRGSFDSLPTDEDEAYPLRSQNKPRRSGSGHQSPAKRDSISSYNHQSQGLSNGGYAAVNGTDTDRRQQSPPEIVFDIGDDDDAQDAGRRGANSMGR